MSNEYVGDERTLPLEQTCSVHYEPQKRQKLEKSFENL